jgi:hypothetical protein
MVDFGGGTGNLMLIQGIRFSWILRLFEILYNLAHTTYYLRFKSMPTKDSEYYQLLQGINAITGGKSIKIFCGSVKNASRNMVSIKTCTWQSVEDALNTGPGKITNTSSSGGINPQMAALALLYGKAVKDFTKKTEGGLTDIRQSIRPDLNPAPVFAGFDLGVRKAAAFGGPIGYGRQNFNKGGLAAIGELDMRKGGESAGPGTGTSDDIPAMLSDGEFVMTAAANNGAGGFKLNKTKKGIELIASSKPNRKKGVDVMNKLMDTFEKYNASGSIA